MAPTFYNCFLNGSSSDTGLTIRLAFEGILYCRSMVRNPKE